MNIFVLDYSPKKAAEYQCNKHIVKMPLETAQLLCSVFNNGIAPYKRTHYNHPCSIFTRTSKSNFEWLAEHGLYLCQEYTERYKKIHKCEAVINWCLEKINTLSFLKEDKLDFNFCCMPNELKTPDLVESYRNYYKVSKRAFAVWPENKKPEWFEE